MINYSSASITPQLAEWHAQVEKAAMELVKKHLLATNDLTEEQLADAIGQALLSGDFQKLVVASTGAQCVTYVPFAREQKLEFRIKELEAEIAMMLPVIAAAAGLESWLHRYPISSTPKLLIELTAALKPIRELRKAGLE